MANSKQQKYSIIYADPPWRYQERTFSGNRVTHSVEDHYATLTTDELKIWNVQSICEKDCLLFMWTSNPHLAEAIDLGQAWGFKYVTVGFVWDKMRTTVGHYTLSQCELCLLFKRKGGKIPRPRGQRNVKQFLSVERGKHSAKPQEVHDRITKMFPSQMKFEMFARQEYCSPLDEGWDHWGNEIEVPMRAAVNF